MSQTATKLYKAEWNRQWPDSIALSARNNLHWSVIPLDSDKRPVKTGGTYDDSGTPKRLKWKHLQTRLPSEQEIRRWQKEYNPPAWAVVTGAHSGVIVLDFDGEPGKQTGEAIGYNPHVQTGSGGKHQYFKHPGWPVQTLNNKSSKDRPWAQAYPGLDIRADGGYAAFCGSNESGKYEWLREPIPDDLSLLPEDLRRFLGLLEPPGATPPAARPRVASPDKLPDILLERALNLAGGRNDACFWLGCQLRDNRVSRSEAESITRAFVRRVPSTNAKGQVEPFTEQEALATLTSAYAGTTRQAWEARERTEEFKPSRHAISNGNGDHSNNEHQTDTGDNEPHFTDMGNAARFIAHHGENIKYCYTAKKWLVWVGRSWQFDTTGAVRRLVKQTVVDMYTEAGRIVGDDKESEKKRKALAAHALKSESAKAVESMLTLAQFERPILREELDQHQWLLNCSNGTLDLQTGKLHEHRRGDLLTICLSTRYDESATCPTWHTTLHQIFNGNEKLIRFWQQAIGYALTGDTSEQCFFLCYGLGSNGKSTLLEVIQAILQEYAQTADFKTFLARDSEGIRNDIARMNGKRFIVAKETDRGKRLAESVIKSLTGGDTITARFLREEYFEFMPRFKLFLAVNHKPVIHDTTRGMWRRVHMIPFAVTFEGNQVDKHLKEKLLAEAPGILAWAVQGCLDWQQSGGLIVPQEVSKATEQYRTEMDTIAQFIADRCSFAEGLTARAHPLFEAYKAWCDDIGERRESEKNFGLRLIELGYVRDHDNKGNFYRGLEIRKSEGTVEPEKQPFTGRDTASEDDGEQAATTKSEGCEGNLDITLTSQSFSNLSRDSLHTLHSSPTDEGVNPLVEQSKDGVKGCAQPFTHPSHSHDARRFYHDFCSQSGYYLKLKGGQIAIGVPESVSDTEFEEIAKQVAAFQGELQELLNGEVQA